MAMSLIESLTRIKNAVYGREVREAIHDGVFRANQIADGADAKADKTQIRQDAVEDLNTQVIQEMTDKDVVSAPELIESRDGEVKLSHRLDRDFGKIDTQVANIENQLEITPDAFEGTDAEKIQQAYDYAMTNNVTKIMLNREYDITGSTILLPEGSWNTPLGYITFTGGRLRKDDPGFMFDSLGLGSQDGMFRIAPQFFNTDFDSTPGPKEIHVFNGDKMIRINVVNCYFRTVGLVKSTTYIQTVRVENCITGYMGCHFIDAPRSYDVEIINPRAESNQAQDKRLIQLVSDTANASYYGLKITGGLIEGFWNTHPIEIGGGYGLKIDGVYFEKNTGSIHIKKTTVADVIGGITNCVFLWNEGVGQDIMIEKGVDTTSLTIEGNTKRRDEIGDGVGSGQYLCNRRLMNPRNLNSSNVNFLGNDIFPRDYSKSIIDIVGGGMTFTIRLPVDYDTRVKDLKSKIWLLSFMYNPSNTSTPDNAAHKLGYLSLTIDGSSANLLYTPILGGEYENYFFTETTTRNIGVDAQSATIKMNLVDGVEDVRNSLSIKEIDSILQV